MNIPAYINKLMMAIKIKGKNIKLDTKQFYSQKSHKYIKKYIFYERIKYEDRYGEEKEKWIAKWEGYNQASLLKYLASYYKGIEEGEASGERTTD